jgi:protein-tyrosine-phosphatase/predicted ATP-grasp superfamily ATP-dependent carboligase
VLGEDTRSFLATVRSLGRGGIEVHVGAAGDAADPAALASKYVTRVHDLPPFRVGNTSWSARVLSILRAERYDLVIPCTDSAALAVYEQLSKFEELTRVALPTREAYDLASDKLRSAELAASLGIPVPRQVVLTSTDAAEEAVAGLGLPLVLKPQSSYRPGAPGVRHSVRKVTSSSDFHAVAREMLKVGPVAVQEAFSGRGVGVELLLHRGRPLMAFQHLRLHEPLNGGGSSYRQSMGVSPDLFDAAKRLLQPLEYTGVAMIEFKVNPQSGAWVFIEINARLWGSLPLAVAAGADFPLALFQMLVYGRTKFPRRYDEGICCRNLRGDLYWQIANLRADRSDPTLLTRPIKTVVIQGITSLARGRERTDTFTSDDPRPGVVEVTDVLRRLCDAAGGKLIRWAAGRVLARVILERRARVALRNAERVLFVCKGNICRSPFAEWVAKDLLPAHCHPTSAGYYPVSGRPSPSLALSAATERGVDLASHRSRSLGRNLIDSADVIFVFDWENLQTVGRTHPTSRRKLHFLGALNPSGPLFIEDPWGKGPENFSAAYTQIADALSAGAECARGAAALGPRRRSDLKS